MSSDSVVDLMVVTTVLLLYSVAERNTKEEAIMMEVTTIRPQIYLHTLLPMKMYLKYWLLLYLEV